MEDGLFCKGGFGLNITSKEARLPLFPPPGRIFAERGSFYLRLLVVRRSAYRFSALSEGFHSFPPARFCSWMFVFCVSIDIRQVSVQRCFSSRTEQQRVKWRRSEDRACLLSVSTLLFFTQILEMTVIEFKNTPPRAG